MAVVGRPTCQCLLILLILSCSKGRADDGRVPVRVMILSCFEIGNDTGDIPGEFQYFAERDHLTQAIEVPGAPHPLVHNDRGLYGEVAGVMKIPPGPDPVHYSCVVTSELVMALCLDPRLDLRKTYWIINGIAGVDPASGSIGSTFWAKHVVDGDALHEIDDTEVPAGWPYGLYAIGTPGPNNLPVANASSKILSGAVLSYTMDFPLNPRLAEWAYQTSKDVALPDSDALKAYRGKYTGFPLAQMPPRVMMGDTLGAARYWHGPKRTQWARDWVKLWTKGEGTFATTAQEHQDYMNTLTDMARKGYLDMGRVMVLRGASNYCMPPPGQRSESTAGDEVLGTLPAFEADYRAASAVANELLKNWSLYEETIPGSGK
jgi:purine nucleoside permease